MEFELFAGIRCCCGPCTVLCSPVLKYRQYRAVGCSLALVEGASRPAHERLPAEHTLLRESDLLRNMFSLLATKRCRLALRLMTFQLGLPGGVTFLTLGGDDPNGRNKWRMTSRLG